MHAAAISLIAAVSLIGTAAAGDEPSAMTPEAFRALVDGRTVHYSYEGEYYGSERFYGRGRATWQNPSGSCEDGNWWAEDNTLCFRYGIVSCWTVYELGEARHAVSNSGFRVDFDRIDDRPLRCEGEPLS